jgi:hypothetical protein
MFWLLLLSSITHGREPNSRLKARLIAASDWQPTFSAMSATPREVEPRAFGEAF